MARRPAEEREFLDFLPPRLTRKAGWTLGALVVLAIVAFLLGDLLMRLTKS